MSKATHINTSERGVKYASTITTGTTVRHASKRAVPKGATTAAETTYPLEALSLHLTEDPHLQWLWSLSHTLFAYLIHWDSSRQSNYVSVHCYSVTWCSYCTALIIFTSSNHG